MARHVADCLRQGGGRDIQEQWGEHPDIVGAIEPSDVVEVLVKASAPGWDSRSCAEGLTQNLPTNDLMAIFLRGDPYTFLTFPRAYELIAVAIDGEIKEADPGKIEKHHPAGKAALEELWEGMKDWVAVHWMPADMPRIVEQMTRRAVVLVN